MKKNKNYFIVLLVNIGIVSVIFFFFYDERSLTNIINAFFFITVFYMIIYLYLFISKGKFFDGITYGARRFRDMIFQREEDIDHLDKLLPSERVNLQVYQMFKKQFFTLLIFLLILQLIYFVI